MQENSLVDDLVRVETAIIELDSKDQLGKFESLTPIEIIKMMSTLPFWCGDNHKHETNPEYWKDFCCTQHVAGLPRHPATKKEMPPTPYQLEFVNAVIKEVTNPGTMSDEDWARIHHMFHVSKGRQMGFTEIVLRLLFHFSFSRYAGSNIGIMAATNGKLANKDLRRLYRLYVHVKSVLTGPVKNNRLEVIDGTKYEAFPASEEAVTGDTDYAAFVMDESAKWKLVDDTPVFNSVMPIVRSNGADLFLVSTYKGPIKMFYKISLDPQEFVCFEYDIWRTEGNLYTREQIENMLATSKEDPDQEYLCKATIGKDSILGRITDDDRGSFGEWGESEEVDEEDDGYVEEDEKEDDWS